AGADVADIGCGAGVALVAMAVAFPASRFHGYDVSRLALDRAEANVAAAGLGNVVLHHTGAEDLPAGPTYDLVIAFDCLHDMTHPAEAIAAVHRSLRVEGTWLIKDIRSAPDFNANRRNPLLALLYGLSVSVCMSSALSEPDGAGLGTLGFNTDVARRMCTE